MTKFTEDEFAQLLRQAEPPIQPVDTQAIIKALQKTDVAVQLARKPLANASGAAKARQVLALSTCVAALLIVALAMPKTPITADTTLAEFKAAKRESEILAEQLKRLTAMDERSISQVSATDIRASESLWMLMQEQESNPPRQRQHAELIVSLYTKTPAAKRCRNIFPDL